MKDLRNAIVAIIVIVVVVNVLTGHGAAIAVAVTALLATVAKNLRPVLIAAALPALLLGGLIYVSPWHRELAVRLMTGSVVVLAIAVLGPLVLDWLEAQFNAYGPAMFGGRP